MSEILHPVKPKVLLTDNVHESAIHLLQEICEVTNRKSLTHEELLDLIPEFDALMVRSASTVSADVIEAGRKLKIVGRAGVGTDNIDLKAATKKGIIVVNSPEGNTVAAAEHTVGMLMALARHIPEADATLKQGEWKRSKLTGVEVFGKTLGVIGLGKIGGYVAKVCLALGMQINVYDPFLSAARAKELGVNLVPLEKIWAESDFITIHAPKTRETMHLVNRETLAKCKPGIRFVNCARGGIIHEQDLYDAVQSGHVAGVALDVYEQEPLHPDTPLLKLGSKAVLTPHLGASTEEAQINVAVDVSKEIRDFFELGYARNAVNIPVLRKDILDPVKDYMPLAETLGRLVRQLAHGVCRQVEVVAQGTVSQHDISPVVIAVLKGILSQNREGINYINARFIAEEQGITVKESAIKIAENYTNLVKVILKTDQSVHEVAGTVISSGIFRIVSVDGFITTLEPTMHILFAPHADKPGMVAKVATVLGQENINIRALQVAGRGLEPGGESMMIFNLDNPLSDTSLKTIRALEGIFEALYIQLT